MADPTWEEPPTYSDDESDSDNDTELPNTDDDSRRRPEKNYVVLTEDDIKRLQNDDIEKVSSILAISPSEASLLLHHYRWQIEELQYEWFADSDSVRRKVGLLLGPTTTTSCQTTTCGICFETIDDFCEGRDFLYTAGCDHPYCKDCWRSYISIAINESGLGCLGLRCPDPKCSAAVRRELVEEVAAREEVEKYSRFFVRSYVEGRREKVKWCVAPGCENAVEYELDGGSSFDVVCGCSHEFCWGCGEDAHRPVVCDTVRMWVLKNSSEAENTNWILAYTKQCPKCKRPIEKRDGCNYMTCSPPCRHHFCWFCLGDMCGHGSCNRYKDAGKRGCDWNNEEERQRQMAKESLERYAHYYERWASNHKSRQKAIQDLHDMENEKLKLLSKKVNKPETELGFIVEAWQQIVECRRVLKWTYAYGYYLPESGKSKVQLFECLQGEAEAALERLHRCAETELTKDFLGDNKDNDDYEPKQDLYSFKQKLVGLTRITCKFFEDLVKALENGLSEAGCSREATRKGKGQKRKTSTSSQVAHHQPINNNNNNNVAFLTIFDDDDDEDDFGTWSCDVCTYINPEGATACVMCHERE